MRPATKKPHPAIAFSVRKTTGRKERYTNRRTLDPNATEDGGTSIQCQIDTNQSTIVRILPQIPVRSGQRPNGGQGWPLFVTNVLAPIPLCLGEALVSFNREYDGEGKTDDI